MLTSKSNRSIRDGIIHKMNIDEESDNRYDTSSVSSGQSSISDELTLPYLNIMVYRMISSIV